jgi:hypothetical protein
LIFNFNLNKYYFMFIFFNISLDRVECQQSLTQKYYVGISFVSPRQEDVGQKCRHLAVGGAPTNPAKDGKGKDGDNGNDGDGCGGGGGSGAKGGDGCSNALGHLPMVSDVTIVMTTFLTLPVT